MLPNPTQVYCDDWLLIFIQSATLIALIVYVWKTWQIATGTLDMAKEAKEAREGALAPRVVIYLDASEFHLAHLVLENVGAGRAVDARFAFDPPLQSAERFGGTEFFKSPKVLPPGQRLVHLFDRWAAYFGANLPTSYKVTVTYKGVETGRTYSHVHELDFAAMQHRHGIVRHGMHDLVRRMEQLGKQLDDRLKGIQRTLETANGQRHLRAESIPFVSARAAFSATYSSFHAISASEGAYVDSESAIAAMTSAAVTLLSALRQRKAPHAQSQAVIEVLLALSHPVYLGDDRWALRLDDAVTALEQQLDGENELAPQ